MNLKPEYKQRLAQALLAFILIILSVLGSIVTDSLTDWGESPLPTAIPANAAAAQTLIPCTLRDPEFKYGLTHWEIDINNTAAPDATTGYLAAPSLRNLELEGEVDIYQPVYLQAGDEATVSIAVRANHLYPAGPHYGGEVNIYVFQGDYWTGTRVLESTHHPPNDNAWHTYAASFTAPADGIYNIAYLVYSPPADWHNPDDAQMDMRLDDANITCGLSSIQ